MWALWFWVVTLNRGDKDMPTSTIPLPEPFLKITPVYFKMALEVHHLYAE